MSLLTGVQGGADQEVSKATTRKMRKASELLARKAPNCDSFDLLNSLNKSIKPLLIGRGEEFPRLIFREDIQGGLSPAPVCY